jgi:hypothetical protein
LQSSKIKHLRRCFFLPNVNTVLFAERNSEESAIRAIFSSIRTPVAHLSHNKHILAQLRPKESAYKKLTLSPG